MTRAKCRQLTVIAALVTVWGIAAADDQGFRWKDGNSFEISRVIGVKRSYQAGARIRLKVFGRSLSTDVAPDPKNGFNVQGYVDRLDPARAAVGANGEWKDGLDGWTVDLPAPQERGENYRLQVFLYCADDASLCAETYGRAAQVVETFHFDVR